MNLSHPPQFGSRYAAAYRSALILLMNEAKNRVENEEDALAGAIRHAENIIRTYNITYDCPVCGGPLELLIDEEGVNGWKCKAGMGYHYVEIRTIEEE